MANNAATIWTRQFTMRKDTDNFYKAFSGILKGLVPAKQSSNFYFLAKSTDGSGSFLLNKTSTNFFETQPI